MPLLPTLCRLRTDHQTAARPDKKETSGQWSPKGSPLPPTKVELLFFLCVQDKLLRRRRFPLTKHLLQPRTVFPPALWLQQSPFLMPSSKPNQPSVQIKASRLIRLSFKLHSPAVKVKASPLHPTASQLHLPLVQIKP